MSSKLLDYPDTDPLSDRTTTENHALDSYQNLLFSIARFREFTGNFPKRITVVGYGFKKARFTELHRKAIRWPLHRFNYIGVDPEDEHKLTAQQGEVRIYTVQNLTILISFPEAQEWLPPLHKGPLWLPLFFDVQEASKESITSIPLLLYIISRIRLPPRLVPR